MLDNNTCYLFFWENINLCKGIPGQSFLFSLF